MTNLPQIPWRKSSRSTQQGECVEVAASWRKSSRSSQQGDCVEVADLPVRDTRKDPVAR